MKPRPFLFYAGLCVLFLCLSLFLVLAIYNVRTDITVEDKIYIRRILQDAGTRADIPGARKDFSAEINTILAIQNSAFVTAPETSLLPKDQPREPKDLYHAKTAYCSDRARYIDKALRLYGFETRYASLYQKMPGKNFFQIMLTRTHDGTQSHALVEVKTSKGWLVVDTRNRWISLDIHNDPVSLVALENFAEMQRWPQWSPLSKEKKYALLERPFYILYGFYSRHGRFYPPYTPNIPDIDYSQFLLNLTGGES